VIDDRLTRRLLQLGMLAVMLAVLPYKLFELDRYFVPKELVLHVVALLGAVVLLLRSRTQALDLADKLLALFLVWSAFSALFSTNHWLAQRALGVSVSSAIVFWMARRVGAEVVDGYRGILAGAAIASTVAATTALLQAYGLDSVYFSLNRAPGGTFGNRNFVAHIAAIGFPALIYCTVTARSALGLRLGTAGTVITGAALVLSRSRAAWLAVAVSLAAVLLPLLASRGYWAGTPVVRRLVRVGIAGALGGVAAMFLPNSLNWSSDSPYLDSARGMVDYSSGSGRGRVAQYRNSLAMATAHPVFGVGPGNWPVRYPRFAPRNDRSLVDDGMTANPWPSSDWVAYLSERGAVATAALLGALALLFLGALRRWSALGGAEEVLAKVALLGTITAMMVVSAFDAALLLAAPAFLAWAVIGGVSGVGTRADDMGSGHRRGGGVRAAVVLFLLVITAASAARSATQVMAISKVGTGGLRAGWTAAAVWDPGSYRINQRVAELHANRGRCPAARTYARRAQELFPNAPAPRRILQRCGGG
jgi:O-antigen ligase